MILRSSYPALAFSLFCGMLLLIQSVGVPSAEAHNNPVEDNGKRRICYREVKSLLKQGKWIDGRIVRSKYIVRYLNDPDLSLNDKPIRIRNSIIENGLDLTQVSSESSKGSDPAPIVSIDQDIFIQETEWYFSWKGEGPYPLLVNAQNVQFKTLVLEKVEFGGAVDFSGASFNGETRFNKSLFHGDVIMNSAEFKQDVEFEAVVFEAKSGWNQSHFVGKAKFKNSTIKGPSDFRNVVFEKLADFGKVQFEQTVRFGSSETSDIQQTVFKNDLIFNEAKFNQSPDFSKISFMGKADFNAARFKGARFDSSTFSGDAVFEEAQFGSERGFFTGVKFEQSGNFKNARFDWVTFEKSLFEGSAQFKDSTIKTSGVFRFARFLSVANFEDSNLGFLSFDDVEFHNDLYLSTSNIGWLGFNGSDKALAVKGQSDFKLAHIWQAVIENVRFESLVDFSNAEFGKPLMNLETESGPGMYWLQDVAFQGGVKFDNSFFKDRVYWDHVEFEKPVDFSSIRFDIDGSCLFFFQINFKEPNSFINHLPPLITWPKNADEFQECYQHFRPKSDGSPYQTVLQFLEQLRSQYRALGQIENENRAFLMIKAKGKERMGEGSIVKKIWSQFYHYCVLGEWAEYYNDWKRVLIVFLILHLMFVALYFRWAKMWGARLVLRHPDQTFRPRLLASPETFFIKAQSGFLGYEALNNRNPLALFLAAFEYSFTLLFKMGRMRIKALRESSGMLRSGSVKLENKFRLFPIVYLEWVLGYYAVYCLLRTLIQNAAVF